MLLLPTFCETSFRHTPAFRWSTASLRDEVAKDVVRSVHTHSTLTDTTPAIIARMDEVAKALASGLSPYAKDENKPTKDEGGLQADRKKLADARLKEQVRISDGVFNRLVSKWADKHGPAVSKTLQSHIHRSQGVDLRGESPNAHPTITTPDGRIIQDPDILACSFCRGFVHRSKATLGSGALKESVKDEIIEVYGIKVIQRKFIKWAAKLVACPDCSLNLCGKTTFPETRG